MEDLISIIIPVFNIENEIARCLDSVLNQTYKNLEIIIVNDGSSDSSGIIADQYATNYPDKIRVFHKTNAGVTSARLLGVEKARGLWIGFVDGDDTIDNDMYEFLIANMKKYEAQISHCGYQMIFDDNRVNCFYDTGHVIVQDKTRGIIDLLEGTIIEPGLWNKLYSKELFSRLLHTDCMPRSIRINEDLLMNFYLFSEADRAVFEDKCKYHYIIRDDSVSRQRIDEHKIYDPIRVKQIIYDTCQDGLKLVAEKALIRTCIYTYATLILEKNNLNNATETVRNIIKSHYDCVKYLNKKNRIMANLIVRCPVIYSIIYPIYAKYFQKKKYN